MDNVAIEIIARAMETPLYRLNTVSTKHYCRVCRIEPMLAYAAGTPPVSNSLPVTPYSISISTPNQIHDE